jgi:hypothetical protein
MYGNFTPRRGDNLNNSPRLPAIGQQAIDPASSFAFLG